MIDLMGGHIQLMFGAVSTVQPHVKSGRLRAIAISSPKRWPAWAQLPTVGETLPGFEAATWYGVLAPAGTSAAILTRLQSDIAAALNQPDVKNYVIESGFEPIGNKPEEFAAVIQRDMQKWGKLIRALGPAAGAL